MLSVPDTPEALFSDIDVTTMPRALDYFNALRARGTDRAGAVRKTCEYLDDKVSMLLEKIEEVRSTLAVEGEHNSQKTQNEVKRERNAGSDTDSSKSSDSASPIITKQGSNTKPESLLKPKNNERIASIEKHPTKTSSTPRSNTHPSKAPEKSTPYKARDQSQSRIRIKDTIRKHWRQGCAPQ